MTGFARLNVIKFANIDDPITRHSDRTVLDGRSVHRQNNARANDHPCCCSGGLWPPSTIAGKQFGAATERDFRFSRLCDIRPPKDCMLPGKATELQPLRFAKRRRRQWVDGCKRPPLDHIWDQICLSAVSSTRLRRSDRVSIKWF